MSTAAVAAAACRLRRPTPSGAPAGSATSVAHDEGDAAIGAHLFGRHLRTAWLPRASRSPALVPPTPLHPPPGARRSVVSQWIALKMSLRSTPLPRRG